MSWLLKISHKYLNESSAICEHCNSFLSPRKITINTEHIYNVGQFFECSCGKSNLWGNSIRNLNNFVRFLKNEPDPIFNKVRYTNGFCYDRFTLRNGSYKKVEVLKNGVSLPGRFQRYDRIGIRGEDNPMMPNIVLSELSPEGDTQHIINWYSSRLNELESLLKEGY